MILEQLQVTLKLILFVTDDELESWVEIHLLSLFSDCWECSEECVHSSRLGFVGLSLHWKMSFVPWDLEYGGTSLQKAI